MERRGAAPPAEHCCVAAFLQQPSTHPTHQHRYCIHAWCNKDSCMFSSPRACQLLLLLCVYWWIGGGLSTVLWMLCKDKCVCLESTFSG
jgi:hypothetical protein